MLLKGGPEPDLAKQFITWALSTERTSCRMVPIAQPSQGGEPSVRPSQADTATTWAAEPGAVDRQMARDDQ